MTREDMLSTQDQAANSKRPEKSLHGVRCERCNAMIDQEKTTLPEIMLNALCLLVLLTLLVPLGYIAERWIEHHLDHPLWNPVWHEPLDSWGSNARPDELLLRHYHAFS